MYVYVCIWWEFILHMLALETIIAEIIFFCDEVQQ